MTVGTELEVDRELLAHLSLFFLPAADVTFGLQDVGNACLQLAVWHGHGVVVCRVGVAETRKHVCNWICHCHWALALPRNGFRYSGENQHQLAGPRNGPAT
jgi:hypothetical protein